MSIICDNSNVKAVTYKGNKVKTIIYKGVKVFSGGVLLKDGELDSDIVKLYEMTNTGAALQSKYVSYAGLYTGAITGFTKAYLKVRQTSGVIVCQYGTNTDGSKVPSIPAGNGRLTYKNFTPTATATTIEIDLTEGNGFYFSVLGQTVNIYIDEIWLE